MATDLENLQTRRSAVLAELAVLTSSSPGGRPNIDGGGMGTVDHQGYKRGLYAELEQINSQLDKLTLEQGPWELPLIGYPG